MDVDEARLEDHGGDHVSSSSASESDEDPVPVESLIAGREKRATAGNRLSTLIDREADDELELLFAEDEEDVEFESADGEDGSDVQLDSSSDDEDDQGPTKGDDDLTGEQELQKQDRAERQAQKRKAQVAFMKPPGLRKRVKVDTTTAVEPTTPAARPKKKSERVSWIPTPDEGPVRSSSRKQTVQNKELVHARMKESEKRRLHQIAVMEAAARRKEKSKPKVMTQADRLAEAERTERKNSKSLNRWEETERKRAEEQKARLAALHNRRLEGPVITWWSGMATWVNDKLTQVGRSKIADEGDGKLDKGQKGKKNSNVASSKKVIAIHKVEDVTITESPQTEPAQVHASTPSIAPTDAVPRQLEDT